MVALLNKGASDDDIQRAEKQLGFKIPPDAVALFKWKNGAAFDEKLPWGAQWLFPLGTPVSLETALKTNRHYRHNEQYRQRMLLLIFEGFGGEEYYLDCHILSASYGRIWKYDLNELEDGGSVWTTMYDSLPAFLQTMIRCYQQQAYTFQDAKERILLRDLKREVKIAAELNPNAKYWKELSELADSLPGGAH